jgi:hypothetical protein
VVLASDLQARLSCLSASRFVVAAGNGSTSVPMTRRRLNSLRGGGLGDWCALDPEDPPWSMCFLLARSPVLTIPVPDAGAVIVDSFGWVTESLTAA